MAVIRKTSLLFVLLSFVATPAASQEAPKGWYIQGGATASILEDSPGTVSNVPAPGNPGATLVLTNEVETGWGGQVALGYDFGRFRVEGEAGYTQNGSDRYRVSSPFTAVIPQDGTNEVLRFMGNGYFDITQGSVKPYVGAGIGVARVHVVTVAATVREPTPTRLIDDRDTVFAYQLMGGVAVGLTPRVRVFGQYRWLDAGTINGRDARGERFTRGISGHNIDLGLRFAF